MIALQTTVALRDECREEESELFVLKRLIHQMDQRWNHVDG